MVLLTKVITLTMKTKISYLIIICLSISISLFGQKKEFKFGKIDMADLKATQCPIDSNAEAYVLGDYGTSYFNYVQEKGFQTIYDRHFRIKILKKTATGWADVTIPLYISTSGSDKETVSGLKAATYNLEDGKIVISKLEKNEIFDEKANKNWMNEKFTLPNVKEGSIIEVSYKIYSGFYGLRDWKFQYSIPVLYTQYDTRIPEYFQYKVFQNGYEPIHNSNSSEPSNVDFTWKERSDGEGLNSVTQTEFHHETVHFTTNVSTYIGENIKSFHNEPFMNSEKNYVSSLEIELESIKFPNSLVKNYSANWESITKELMEYDYFGDITKKEGATNDIVKTSTQGLSQPLDKAVAIYDYIRNNFKWNGLKRLYASDGIRKTISVKSGNSADINLLLVAALKNADLQANPVALSTRDNGIILMSYPVLQKLNYVIASVDIDGKRYLLDATDKHATFGFLPERCLNGQGRIISETKPGTIDLTTSQNYLQNIDLSLKIADNGDLSGTWTEVRKGYAAHNFRDAIAGSKSKEDFVTEKQKDNPGLTINKFEFENLDSLQKDVRINYEVTLTGQTESTGNLLMIHPLLTEQLKENYFKLEDRKFPVDYSYNFNKTFIAQYEIPQGYQIETLPKPVSMVLPNRDATFLYNVVAVGNKVQVLRKLMINKSLFLPEEYPALREFYNKMVAKEAEVIVLKKL
jgi:transglutaminase-like putative cysteine protease